MNSIRISAERKKLGLSQEELAEKIGVSQKSISKYERGTRRPTYETLVSMANLFGVTVDYLLGSNESDTTKITLSQDESKLLELFRSFQKGDSSVDVVQASLNNFFPGVVPRQAPEENKLLDSFRLLTEDNKDILIGEVKKLLKEQRYESVAADIRQAK